jgi:hypothetical protein
MELLRVGLLVGGKYKLNPTMTPVSKTLFGYVKPWNGKCILTNNR